MKDNTNNINQLDNSVTSDDLNDPNGIWHQPVTRHNMKHAFKAMVDYAVTELAVYAIFYGILALLGTTIGLIIWVSAWFLVLLVPFGAVAWHLFKKYHKS